MRETRIATLTIAAVFVLLATSRASSAVDPCVRNCGGTAFQYPTSHVQITSVSFPSFSFAAACVTFVVQGSTPVSSATFRFWSHAAGSKGSSPLVVNGPIEPGVPQNATYISFSDPPSFGAECELGFGTGVFVQHVAFADGSIWDAPANAPTGALEEPIGFYPPGAHPPNPLLQPAPPNTVSFDAAQNAPDGRLFQYSNSQIKVTKLTLTPALSSQLNRNGTAYFNACVSFENNSSQVLSSATFAFLPKMFSDEPGLVVNGPIPVGAAPSSNALCALTSGKSVAVSKVVYADGSTWTGPPNEPQGAEVGGQ
jgi:hypothetical protein